MKKLINKIKQSGWPVLFILAILSLSAITSCKEDENGNGIPVIHYLRMTDPALADSTFTDVNQGTMIAVIGENLDGVMEVYINNQEINFNSTYSTPTSLIITIPYDESFQLTSQHPELPSELRIVTTHGTATFPMHVLSPGPAISYISAFYPIETGDEITLMGQNFYEINRIYFSRDSLEVTQPITDYQVSEDFDQITFSVPDAMMGGGYIIVDCYTSDASIAFLPNGPQPVITGISSIMPVAGSEVTISGKNFINVSGININGEFDIPAENIETSASMDQLKFIMPQAPTRSGKLRVMALGGTAELEDTFYPLENVVLNWDDIGSFSWGDYGRKFDNASPDKAPYTSDGGYSGIIGTVPGAPIYWWGQSVNNTVWPGTDVIPGDTPTDDLELQFECFLAQELEGPTLLVQLANNFDKEPSYIPTSTFTGETEINEWMQCSIPLESLVEETTWQAFLNRINQPDDNGQVQPTNMMGFYIINANSDNDEYVEIYFDNLRIVKKKETEQTH